MLAVAAPFFRPLGLGHPPQVDQPAFARSCLLILLCTCLGAVWSLEQPSGSLAEFYPAFREVIRSIFDSGGHHAAGPLNNITTFERCSCYMTKPSVGLQKLTVLWHHFLLCQLVPTHTQVQSVRWWMYHYKSLTPKRHYAYSNSKPIHRLDKGVLQGWKAKKKEGNGVVTVARYIDANGKKRYKGTKSLKSTEPLDCSNVVQLSDIFSTYVGSM